MIAEENKVVSIDYTLRNEDGDVLDSSAEGAPLTYLHGASNIIPGLEKAIQGKQVGDAVEAVVAPAEAYGERQDEQMAEVPRSQLAGIENLTVGMQLQAETPQGGRVVRIAEIRDETVVIDANHPLAGMTLHFAVKIADIREATSAELEHGHVH